MSAERAHARRALMASGLPDCIDKEDMRQQSVVRVMKLSKYTSRLLTEERATEHGILFGRLLMLRCVVGDYVCFGDESVLVCNLFHLAFDVFKDIH